MYGLTKQINKVILTELLFTILYYFELVLKLKYPNIKYFAFANFNCKRGKHYRLWCRNEFQTPKIRTQKL